ncbi:penicillin acylase family protein [Pseudoduganella sp. LjRoot289]|uniref:penicillin acylase family protein n=1 Tax=Pseudoduganella sp. LjRoot289 TaxID=3342314 RepID=UPI003ED0DA77
MKKLSSLLLCLAWFAACGGRPASATPALQQPQHQRHPPRLSADVARTSNGLAHIRAQDFASLGYGMAYAYAEDNVCMLADSMLTVRGERSRFFGGDAMPTKSADGEYSVAIDYLDEHGFDLKNEDSDFFFKGYLDLEQLRAGYSAGSREIRDLLMGYAAGYNRYLRDHAGTLPAACSGKEWVRPISVDDVYLLIAEKALHASGQIFAKEVLAATREPGTSVARRAMKSLPQPALLADLVKPRMASNGLAIGKEASQNRRGMLLANPHYPWTSTDRFYQVHLTVPGRYDAMGVMLGGLPIVVIGFNKDVAWTHTVTKAAHFSTFRLALDAADPTGTTYLVDGTAEKMSEKTVAVELLQPDGGVATKRKVFYFSKQGAVMVKPEAGVVWSSTEAYVLADANRNNTRLLEQWLAMGRASSVRSMKRALNRIAGLPWVNTVAADRDGNTLYADASAVPALPTERFLSDCLVFPALLGFDGARASCGWGTEDGAPEGLFNPANAPSLMRKDYVANSNDGYWLSNSNSLLLGPPPFGYSPMYGSAGIEQSLRTRSGFSQVDAALARSRQLSPDDLQEMLFANRVHAAELVLPDLLPACAAGDAVLVQACKVLAAWDRCANLDSQGAILFREFWNTAARLPNRWRVPLNPADPVNTPYGVAPSAMPAMLAALKEAALKMQAAGVPLDGKLGDYQADIRNGKRVPVHGGIGDIDGSYNSVHMSTGLSADGYRNIAWGTSYIQLVAFEAWGPQAQGLLVYGQSTDPKSSYYDDQVPLYAAKQLQPLPFSQQDIRADRNYRSQRLSE